MAWLMASTALGRLMGLGLGVAVQALAEVTLQTSVTHRSSTYYFAEPGSAVYDSTSLVSFTAKAVPVGQFLDTQPFALSGLYDVVRITPDGALVTSGSYTQNGVPQSNPFAKNGAMINPWFDVATGGTAAQAFDGMLGAHSDPSGQASAVHVYSGALQSDPVLKGSAISVTPGAQMSIVKSVRAAGLTTPGPWRHFDDWCVLHIVNTTPPADAFAPCPSALNKTSRFTAGKRNKFAIPGFQLSDGMPTLSDCVGGDYFRSFQPYWVGNAEQRRRYMINPADSTNVGYSRDYGQLWNDYAAAILAGGPSVSDTELNKALTFGTALIGYLERGLTQAAGAGQWNGHKWFAQLAGHVFCGADAQVMGQALQIVGNPTHQQFYVPASYEGIPTNRPGNHDHNQATATAEHIGRADWMTSGVATFPPQENKLYNSDPDRDYGFTAGIANFIEMLNICLLKAGPGGFDGADVIAGLGSKWEGTSEASACIAFMDRYRTFCQANVYALSPATARALAYYDARRGDLRLPRYKTTPDAFIPLTNLTTYLNNDSANGNGRFKWDLTNAGHDGGAPVLEWQVQYSLDARSWVNVTTQGASGTQTGLTPVKHYVRWRRRNEIGWGPWSHNYERKTGEGERCTVTPAGSTAAAAVNTVAPTLMVPRYPRTTEPLYIPVGSPMDLSVQAALFVSRGYWTGNLGTPLFQWRRNGADIPGEQKDNYVVSPADIGTSISCAVTHAGVTAVTPAATIPTLPALPAGTIIDTSFDASFGLFYYQVWDTMRLNSTSCAVRLAVSNSAAYTVGEVVTQVTGASGVVSQTTTSGGQYVFLVPSTSSTFVVGQTLTGGTSGAAQTVTGVTGGVVLLPLYTRLTDDGEAVVTTGVVRAVKTASFPSLQGNLAARQVLTVGTIYDVVMKVPIGADSVPTANTVVNFGSAAGGTQYCTVTIPAQGAPTSSTGAAVSNLTISSSPANTTPKEVTISFRLTAAAAALWFSVGVGTSTGNLLGGNPSMSEVSVKVH